MYVCFALQNTHVYFPTGIFLRFLKEGCALQRSFFVFLTVLYAGWMLGSSGVAAEAAPRYQPATEAGVRQLEADWLFQCDGNPTFEIAEMEIRWAREAAGRIEKMDGAPDLAPYLAELKVLERRLAETPATEALAREIYLAVRRVKREIVMRNPLLDFDEILLIDNPYPNSGKGHASGEWIHEALHRNGFMATDGGKLLITGLNPGDLKRNLLPEQKGSFWRPDLSFDAQKILLSYRPEGERSFHLYEVNANGTGLVQLTRGDYDDLDPIYTPEGKIVFCTTRQHSYVRCGPFIHSFALARCDADGHNIYVISANGEPEYLPHLLHDGRVIFTRWEYTDKSLWRVQSLWTTNPDGTNPQIFWGNQSVWPDVLTEATPIPGSKKVMFTGVGHHAWFDGCIGVINPEEGLDYPHGLSKITREVAWPEVGNGPQEPAPEYDYHAAGRYYAYKTPHPLSEQYMLVSARAGGHLVHGGEHFAYFKLYFQDVYGNKELVYQGDHNAYHAVPFRPRTVPLERPDVVKWPEIDPGKNIVPEDGILYSNNVFEGAPEILREKGKYIRVIQMDPKTYTTWHKTVQHDGPAVSVFQADGVKRILGTVPIEADGSVNFRVPPGEAIFFQMLDENGMAIHVMRTFTYVMPGEVRGCFGCHEMSLQTRGNMMMSGGNMSLALRKPAAELTPPAWGRECISYARFVQPVLDRNCAQCHQNPEHEAYTKLNMTERPSAKGWWGNVYASPNDVSPFTEPYLTLVSGDCGWGHGAGKVKDERNVPVNLAGVFVVEGYDTLDPAPLKTLPPYTTWSPRSTLIHHATSGEHHDVSIPPEDAQRLIAWVDCNGPYLGDKEVRSMYDPYSPEIETVPPVRPRIRTAPVINRFNIRQDGDSEKVALGPVELMPGLKRHLNRLDFLHFKRMPEYADAKQDVEIVYAAYGAAETWHDATEKVRAAYDGSRQIRVSSYNDDFGDPIQNTEKFFRLILKYPDGTIRRVLYTEIDPPIIPLPEEEAAAW